MDLFYRISADAVVVLHFAYVAFVVLGLVAILVGLVRQWRWTRNFWFRALHLFAILFVVAEALLGITCPLTSWESVLREKAGQSGYTRTFIQHWLHKVLFYDAEPWIFATLYTVFGLLVLAAWLHDRSGNRGA